VRLSHQKIPRKRRLPSAIRSRKDQDSFLLSSSHGAVPMQEPNITEQSDVRRLG